VTGAGGHLAALLDADVFIVTSEVVPPRSGDVASARAAAQSLVGSVDAINVTDNPRASAHMSPLAGVHAVHDAGVEPTLQLVARDRNRLAIAADLLGGWALGARNLLVLAGDPIERGDEPDAASVFDLRADEVVALARRIRDEGVTASGTAVADPPRYLIGVADVPLGESYTVAKLEARIDAGADVVWTQIAFDVERLEAWLDLLRDRGILERVRVLVGLVPLRSAANARFLDGLYGVHVPEAIHGALAEAGDDAEHVGLELTIDVVRRLRTLDGVAGVHLMGIGRDDLVRAVVEGAGLFPRPTGG
jgi:methylenetetrahydrofolate reductase (NADPH)